MLTAQFVVFQPQLFHLNNFEQLLKNRPERGQTYRNKIFYKIIHKLWHVNKKRHKDKAFSPLSASLRRNAKRALILPA